MENQFNITKEQYLTMRSTWAAKKHHDASDIILYNILRTKPADRGFSAKDKNIQANDPWFAYHNALYSARMRVYMENKYSKQFVSTWARGEEQIKNNKEHFLRTFGFEMPEGVHDMLNGANK
jgi:hypothetical protein